MDGNQHENVFRFVHIRPPVEAERPRDPDHRDDDPPRDPRRDDPGREPRRDGSDRSRGPTTRRERERLIARARRELQALEPGIHLHVPTMDDRVSGVRPLAINPTGARRLSSGTRAILDALATDRGIEGTPVTELLGLLDVAILDGSLGVALDGPAPPSTPDEIPRITSVGVADLMVVKQQIKRYEESEIAHIENVLDGESKVRTHRHLERLEEVLATDRERTATQENELHIADRFELKKETSRTVQKDKEAGFGLSVSGRYGPSVEFSSEAQIRQSSSTNTATRNAVGYAKDVIERSKDTVVDRTREQRRVTRLFETEETNQHTLANDSGTHVSGIYQFVDKIYESQVFSYGLREIFDFMVPEPASYLWHLERTPNPDIELPEPPIPLDIDAPDATYIDHENYVRLAARYRVEGLNPPPPEYLVRRSGVTHGEGDDSEEGKARSFEDVEITIPSGYTPLWSEMSVVATSDNNPQMVVTIGHQMHVLEEGSGPGDLEKLNLTSGSRDAYTLQSLITNFADEAGAQVDDEKVRIHIFGNETANYTVKVKITFQRKEIAIREWRLRTYEAIAEGHRNAQLEYQQAVEVLRARAEADEEPRSDYGDPPARNLRMIRGELKKHCLAVLRREHGGGLSTPHTSGSSVETPPEFDLATAMPHGSVIRFFENAFEWDQLQYATYPYFWARKPQWADQFQLRNMDPILEEFLSAGSARVVVPVRPGFEEAVTHFLETGEIWDGTGEPSIGDPLYRPIVDEIRERAGADQGEVPVGDPWDTRLPTAAVWLRRHDSLPEWRKLPNTDWEWERVAP